MALVSYDVVVLEKYIDILGHMNNAAYLTLFEEARWDMLTTRGFGVDHIRAVNQSPIVLEVDMKFQKEVLLREKVTIETDVTDYVGKIGKMTQTMRKSDGAVASEAVFIFGLFDLNTRRLIEPTPEWRKVMGL